MNPYYKIVGVTRTLGLLNQAYAGAATGGQAEAQRQAMVDDFHGTGFGHLVGNLPAIPESPPRRDPVAPWERSRGGQNCTTGYNWTTREWEDESHAMASVALYSRLAPDGETGNEAACEACAERAGVFGPVSAPLLIIDEVTEFTEKQWEFLATIPKPAGERGVHWTFEPKPACAGPLATHGTPVLRWRKETPYQNNPTCDWLCEPCYLNCEQEAAELSQQDDVCFSEKLEPPARVGTVPQVFGLNVGIWASRGMRG